MRGLIILFIFLLNSPLQGQVLTNGFDLSNSSIPRDKILHGGPPRDGIPSINNPKFDQRSLPDEERILGVYYNGVAKAYPVRILDVHELVNDEFDGKPVLISYCPLCGSGIAFISRVEGNKLEFGVSGLLYNSDVLMYDRQTESLWSQLMMRAISGPMKGKRLRSLVTENLSWGSWREKFPQSLVLTEDTGYERNYSESPYSMYAEDTKVYYPVAHQDSSYPKKEKVLGLKVKGKYRVYPFSELAKAGDGVIRDNFRGVELEILFRAHDSSAEIIKGKYSEAVTSYWFAWIAFHPGSSIYKF